MPFPSHFSLRGVPQVLHYKLALPGDADGKLVAEAIGIKKLLMSGTIFVHEPGDLHVVTAIFGDFHEPALPKPLDCLHAFGGLLDPESGAGD